MILRRSLAAPLMCLACLASGALAGCGGSQRPSVSSASATTATAAPAGTDTSTAVATPTATATATPSGSASTSSSAAAVTTTASTTSPPPEVPAGHRAKKHGSHPVVSSDVSIPAAFLITPAGGLSPPTVSVPTGVTIALSLENHDHAAHTLVVATPRPQTVHAAAGGRATALLPAPPKGSYRILLDGATRARLIVGVQGGP